MEQQQTPKEAAQAGNYSEWEYIYRSRKWIPVPKKERDSQS